MAIEAHRTQLPRVSGVPSGAGVDIVAVYGIGILGLMRTSRIASPIQRSGGSALWMALVAIVAVLAGIIVARPLFDPAPEYRAASMYPQARAVEPFELHDADGNAFTEADFTGGWSLVFFGFTNCPDICPDTLGRLATAMERLDQMRVDNPPRVVFVSVDPERDDGEAMRDYVKWFDDDFRAITGDDEALMELTRQLGALYVRQAADDTGFYSVDHSGMIVIVDPEGRMVGRFPQPLDTEAMIADLFELSRRRGA